LSGKELLFSIPDAFLNRLHRHFSSDTGIMVLPIDLDNDLAQSTAYMREKEFGLGVYTSASPVPEALFHGLIPTTVIIGRNGKIIFFHEGEGKYDTQEFIDLLSAR
jgi:hypothetical protein